jgi:hypothetical protein
MVNHSKRRSEQHLIDSMAQDIFRATIPKHWVLRDYRPDYGLDYNLEIFKLVEEVSSSSQREMYETLGEHIFIQLKGCKETTRIRIKLFSRYNVEKGELLENEEDLVGEMDVVSFPLEISELITIQRMGSALPVLLVVVDIQTETCHFVCLNDYIDKLLIPKHQDYTSAEHRTIRLSSEANSKSTMALRWYAKRAKLMAAFQKFVFQHAELEYAFDTPDFERLAKHFAKIIVNYDFWEDTEMWKIINYYGVGIKNFISKGTPEMTVYSEKALERFGNSVKGKIPELLKRQEILNLWNGLAILPKNYEEVCREWFLPTPLGYLSSYE